MSEMNDRLSQIWKGFEQRTSRRLTGSGVDNIPRPQIEEMERHRSLLEDAHRASAVPMPDGVPEPSRAAFDALRERLTGFDAKGRPEKRRTPEPDERPSAGQSYSQSFSPATARNSGARGSGAVLPGERLMADLKATENLTARRDVDYLSHSMKAKDDQPRKRRKFLGLF